MNEKSVEIPINELKELLNTIFQSAGDLGASDTDLIESYSEYKKYFIFISDSNYLEAIIKKIK